MMSPRMPTCFLEGSPKVKPAVSQLPPSGDGVFQKTGLFPIMHVMVIKRSIYEKDPWVAQTLYKAFCEAKDICMRDLYDTNILRVACRGLRRNMKTPRHLMTTDYWPYGLSRIGRT